jgi:hypothetical protein
MNFEIVPIVKCGDLIFLTDRANVRLLLGKYNTFKKSKTSENLTDDFEFCHAYYNTFDQLIAIEFFPEADLRFSGEKLFSLSAKELVNMLKTFDEAVVMDEYSIFSKALGICVEIDEGDIKSVLVSTADYYEGV